jgi:tryptophan-rich sensory protein
MDLPAPGARATALAASVILCLAVAWAGSAVTIPAVQGWYQTLHHPAITPPDGLFAPVWTMLYLMMAVAGWRAWEREGFGRRSPALWLFLLQLALNGLWSVMFFGWHWIGGAVLEIAVLWLAIATTTRHFARLDRVAFGLMLPYLAWVSFAAVLNLAFWVTN